jgi:Transglycosylase SLT domain/SPOR domain
VRATRPYSTGALAGKAIALAALALCLSARAASADAGPATDNALATLCGIVESSAEAEGLPVGFFTKLIWRESSFRPTAISPAGAQGVAQFMPETASERGLADPFDPASAIPASARFLGELKRRFGNLGLAAAAYNAGERAVAKWLANEAPLPFETQDYVLAITGHEADQWRSGKPLADAPPGAAPPASAPAAPTSPAAGPPVSALPPSPPPERARSCLSLIASLRTTTAASPVVSGWFAPWGVQIAASFSRASAMRAFVRVQHDFYSVIGGKNPFVLGSVVRSRGFRPFYRVRIGAQSRREADKICTSLEAAGGACVVLRS